MIISLFQNKLYTYLKWIVKGKWWIPHFKYLVETIHQQNQGNSSDLLRPILESKILWSFPLSLLIPLISSGPHWDVVIFFEHIHNQSLKYQDFMNLFLWHFCLPVVGVCRFCLWALWFGNAGDPAFRLSSHDWVPSGACAFLGMIAFSCALVTEGDLKLILTGRITPC